MEYSGLEQLITAETGLKKYNRELISSILSESQVLISQDMTVVDFGAGTGSLAEIFKCVTDISPICIEIDRRMFSAISDKGFTVKDSLMNLSQIDFIYSSNVLEHILDDVGILQLLNKSLKDNGILVLFLPAFMRLYSKMDSDVGHYRRYGMDEICQKLEHVNFKVQSKQYFDSVGYFAWLLFKFLNKDMIGKHSASKMFKFYDSCIFPVSRWLDKVAFKSLFGKNILIVARK